MLNKSCELLNAEGHAIIFYFRCLAQSDMTWLHTEVRKEAFLNLWSMASSILIVNCFFLGEQSEFGADGEIARNNTTRLNWHLRQSKASSVTGQVFPFSSLSFLHLSKCWDKHLCLLAIFSAFFCHPRIPKRWNVHQHSKMSLKKVCAMWAAFLWIFMPPCLELRSDKSYDTCKYSIKTAINIH